MITRLLSRHLYFFCSAGPKIVGGKVYADVPEVKLPTKPKMEDQQGFPMSLASETFNYLKKDVLPNCRYFAVEHKNRIYRFYNAYYYPLGRMINRVAQECRGRASPHYKNYVANVKSGDVCVIVNIEDPLVTGKKLLYKKFRYHTGFVGRLKQYTYKHVLNTKPELLYHFLLRRTMPKNKLSVKYMENVILCRGPMHNLKYFPEFAPDKKRYSLLPQVDLIEALKKDEGLQVIQETYPGEAQKILNKKIEKYYTQSELEQMRREKDEVVEDLTRIHEDAPRYKTVPSMTKTQYETLLRKERKIEERYKPVRAPYKKKKIDEDGLKVYTSERKARKDPNYELLKNEQLQEVDDENVAEFPLKEGGHTMEDFLKDKDD